MKFLTQEAYESSPNRAAGISEETEERMVGEAVKLILTLSEQYDYKRFPFQVGAIALNMLHLVIKLRPFSEFDRMKVAAVCFFLSNKMDHQFRIKLSDVCESYFKNTKRPRGRVLPFEEVREQLEEEFLQEEFNILSLIHFDFDFDNVFDYIDWFG